MQKRLHPLPALTLLLQHQSCISAIGIVQVAAAAAAGITDTLLVNRIISHMDSRYSRFLCT